MRFRTGIRNSALALVLLASTASAQVPGTDLYLVELQDGKIPPGATARNLTARAGYDNQPAFLPDGSGLRYTVIDADGQADIWLLPLSGGEARRLTLTDDTSEYSATPIPGDDRFSVVRVEPDSTQRLWSFAADGSEPRLLLEDVAPVGYHAWGDDGDLVLFILGSPHSLHRARVGEAGSTPVVGDIGRCLQRIPGDNAWSFPRADDEAGWLFTRLDAATGDLGPIAPAPAPAVQDYCWSPSGELWSSDGSRILRWEGGEWTVAGDLKDQGIASITRMAIAPDGSQLVFAAADARRQVGDR